MEKEDNEIIIHCNTKEEREEIEKLAEKMGWKLKKIVYNRNIRLASDVLNEYKNKNKNNN